MYSLTHTRQLNLFILLLILFNSISISYSLPFYQTLLYGEKLKGFLTINPADENGEMYIVSFDIRQQPNSTLIWAVHTSSAPYDMAVMTDNCKRVKKSPPVVKNMPLTDSTISGDDLAGNTLVISGDNSEVLACATVIIPGKELMHASFHQDPLEGHVHIIPMKNNAVRLVPDLKYMQKYDYIEPEKKIMTWAFVESCQNDSTQYSDGSEIGIDSRATFVYSFPDSCVLKALALYKEDQFFACSYIVNVEPRTLKSLGVNLRQKHYFEPVYGLDTAPDELHIRDDCLDISTEIIHKSYETFYPSMNVFGSDSIMLKSLVQNDRCSVLRPQFAKPAAIANFIHPIFGRISLVDTDDKILLTGELRNVFDEMATRATIIVSNETAKTSSCPHFNCDSCRKVENAAVVTGKNEASVTLTGTFEWFNISEMKSAVVDLEWMKVCANLTVLPTGALTINALIKKVSPFESPTVASVVALEYPANNYTEILINKKQTFSHAAAHFRPLDRSITDGPPCGEQNLGAINKVSWINEITTKLGNAENDSSVIFDEQFVTGTTSMLGTSLLLKDGNEVYCGYFEPLSERTVAFAEFEKPFKGYIKLTQYISSNWEAGFPTEVYYSLAYEHQENADLKQDIVNWDIVYQMNTTCNRADVFNPMQVESADCSRNRYDLCPIGSAANRSRPLLLRSRWHLTAQNLPLSGANSIIGENVRLTSTKNPTNVGCYPLRTVSEATFPWVVYKDVMLSAVQKIISEKTGVPIYKIEVDFTRELYQTRCAIYRITILEVDEKLEKILNSFDMEKRKFKNDTDLVCKGNFTTPSKTSTPAVSNFTISGTPIPSTISKNQDYLWLITSFIILLF